MSSETHDIWFYLKSCRCWMKWEFRLCLRDNEMETNWFFDKIFQPLLVDLQIHPKNVDSLNYILEDDDEGVNKTQKSKRRNFRHKHVCTWRIIGGGKFVYLVPTLLKGEEWKIITGKDIKSKYQHLRQYLNRFMIIWCQKKFCLNIKKVFAQGI